MQNIPPRPKWNHPDVKSAAALTIVDDVSAWAIAMGVMSADADKRELAALVTLSILESADAYQAARYLDSFMGWPVNGELVRIIDRAFMSMPKLTTPFIHKWVMEHQVRFPAKKGNTVRFLIGDREFSGVIMDVLPREARGWVELLNVKEKGRVIPLDAEHIIKVTSTGDARQPNAPGPNNGGTPIAPRAGAILKDPKAAAA